MSSDKNQILLEAHEFWNSQNPKRNQASHILGSGHWPWKKWAKVGQDHLAMFKAARDEFPIGGPLNRLLEWGPGGGSNLVAFSEVFDRATGVDISPNNLFDCALACEKKVSKPQYFEAFPIAIDGPDAALGLSGRPFDFLICTAVIQHLPFVEYLASLLELWRVLLRPESYALVQFRTHHNSSRHHRRKDLHYDQNVSRWLMIEADDFVKMAALTGWRVCAMTGHNPPSRTGYVYAWLVNP